MYGVDYSITFRKVEPDDIEQIKKFDCGNKNINFFIQNECLESKKNVTYLFVDDASKDIIAFCSICCSGILLKDSDGKVRTFTNIPSVEIDFFAVDEKYSKMPLDKDSTRYETLSRALFGLLIKYIENITRNYVGATHISLYSVPQAINFYKRSGFVEFDSYMQRDKKNYIARCTPMFLTL